MAEPREHDIGTDEQTLKEAIAELGENADLNDAEASKVALDDEKDVSEEDGHPDATGKSKPTKKKKSKKSKVKKLLTGGGKSMENGGGPASKLTPEMVDQVLEMNPSLREEVAGMDKAKAVDTLKKLDVADLLTGMAISGKNQKDMASYKFWQTQPVPRFDDSQEVNEGPIKIIEPDKVPKEPRPLPEGFEWVTMNLEDEKELQEVHELLVGHYVEDKEAMFRLEYSTSFLNWALKSPGWRKEWHIGVRATTKTKKLLAFISAVPMQLRVRSKVLNSSEVNFLCVHKQLRSKRLAPVLIEEITRRCYQVGVYQAIYTAGTVLPKPVSSCRYFHRPLDWRKLYDVGFSALPHGTTPDRMVLRNHVPSKTALPGLRPMETKDIDATYALLHRYLKRFLMAPEFTKEEFKHLFTHDETTCPERVVWTYVVEDPSSHKITDFTSFYCLESGVIGNAKHSAVRAAYSFYYGTETAFANDEKKLKERLSALITDSLVLAKKFKFDVFNALTLLDNPLFLEPLKFGRGDGQLHYYLFNYRTPMIPGGVDAKNSPDERQRGGVGVVML